MVDVLLQANAPILIRNRFGKTQLDVASSGNKVFLHNYLQRNKQKLRIDYNIIQKLAKKRYSSSQCIMRIFVIGDPGAGKSSLIESLKREGYFQFLRKVSESSVPPRTSGIIPSIHTSKHYGKVLFYDFAGDPEYYSSHAAVLESFALCRSGSNVFIIIADLRKDNSTIQSSVKYWYSFIQHQRFISSQPFLVVIGSHSDLITKEETARKGKLLEDLSRDMGSNIKVSSAVLDCCQPGSKEISNIQKEFIAMSQQSPPFELSVQTSVLLGLLENDFSNVTACSVQTILSHIEDTGILLPKTTELLHPILQQLNEIGYLLLIGDKPHNDNHVILNTSQLTHRVHEKLFSKKITY